MHFAGCKIIKRATMKIVFKSVLFFAFLFTSTNACAQKVSKQTKLKVEKSAIKYIKKDGFFSMKGNYILAPKGMIFVQLENAAVMISNETDSKLDNSQYIAYFEQFDFVGEDGNLRIVTCSCDYAEDASEGDVCEFALGEPGTMNCQGRCSGDNEGGTCKLSIRVISPDGVQVYLY